MADYVDKQEFEIVKELIKNPRLSDNKVSKNTNIPLKTVNRKRKKLETRGLLHFFTYLDTGAEGTGDFGTRQLYIITFRAGITRKNFLDMFDRIKENRFLIKHVFESHLGEKDGRLILVLVLESRQESDIIEIFNAEILPIFEENLSGNAIHDVCSITLNKMIHLLHNYSPSYKKGIINKNSIFVADYLKGDMK